MTSDLHGAVRAREDDPLILERRGPDGATAADVSEPDDTAVARKAEQDPLPRRDPHTLLPVDDGW